MRKVTPLVSNWLVLVPVAQGLYPRTCDLMFGTGDAEFSGNLRQEKIYRGSKKVVQQTAAGVFWFQGSPFRTRGGSSRLPVFL